MNKIENVENFKVCWWRKVDVEQWFPTVVVYAAAVCRLEPFSFFFLACRLCVSVLKVFTIV